MDRVSLSLGFCLVVSVWAQECRGMHMEVRQLTGIGSLLLPCESWESACAAVPLPTESSCWAYVCFGEYSFVSANTWVSKENWESTLSITWVPGMEWPSGLAHALLFSTPLLPLHYVCFFCFWVGGLRLTVSPKLTSNWAVLVPWSPRHWNSYLWATMPIANYYYFVIWEDGLLLEEQSFLLQELRSLTLLCFFRYLAVPSRFPGNGIPRRRRWIFWPWWLLGSRHGSGKMCLTLQHSTQGAYPWWNPNRSLPYNWNISRT